MKLHLYHSVRLHIELASPLISISHETWVSVQYRRLQLVLALGADTIKRIDLAMIVDRRDADNIHRNRNIFVGLLLPLSIRELCLVVLMNAFRILSTYRGLPEGAPASCRSLVSIPKLREMEFGC
jgi:hypothetical protein